MPLPQPEYPVNILAIEGRACKLYRNAEQHQSLERMDGMLPWNGQQDNMIDRFDGRALLDFYRESDGVSRDRPKTADDRRLERVRPPETASKHHGVDPLGPAALGVRELQGPCALGCQRLCRGARHCCGAKGKHRGQGGAEGRCRCGCRGPAARPTRRATHIGPR
jgi:hypothetical protein